MPYMHDAFDWVQGDTKVYVSPPVNTGLLGWEMEIVWDSRNTPREWQVGKEPR